MLYGVVELKWQLDSTLIVYRFTPKNDQFQISPAASPEIFTTKYEELGFS